MSVRLEDFSLFSDQEKQVLVFEHKGSKVDLPVDQTIVQLFEEQVAKSPNAVAWICGSDSMTYNELNQKANQLASYLYQEYGVRSADRIGLYMKRSGEMIVSLLAILKTGAAYVPIDPEYPEARIKYILDDACITVCITSEETTASLQSLDVKGCEVVNYFEIGQLENYPSKNHKAINTSSDLVYIMYTSGSTGNPKGVAIEHRNLVNYICWANQYYFKQATGYPFALFTSIAFDLTCTCIFSSILRGDTIVIYEENEVSELLLHIFREDSGVRAVKLTPSHISMLNYLPVPSTKICCAIVGGEALTEGQVKVLRRLNPSMRVYNEYGPTEATVGCMIEDVSEVSGLVTIGKPIYNTAIYILDENLQLLPTGVAGELCISGAGLAREYINKPDLTALKFCSNPYEPGSRLYRSGDLARRLPDGRIELLGRKDTQVKLRGYRIELEEIETTMIAHPDIVACTADIRQLSGNKNQQKDLKYCTACGIASNYPGLRFDAEGVCSMCRDYEQYKDKAQQYFKSIQQLKNIFEEVKTSRTGTYDCLMLYSGGKDSTYVLCKLVKEFNLKVLAFSFDNGYISDQAKANIVRVTNALGVDHVFGTTPGMNEIFVDSLMRHSNVCEGCFKTIYTLGISLAKEKNIHCVVTGLSRGQLYETRLYQLFGSELFDSEEIDKKIIDARKAYHSMDDSVSRCIDTSLFASGEIFNQVRIIDYFRYASVELREMYDYLDKHVPWVRPSDTGRSTNCRINDLGIYVHKKQKGYHNYSLPYSWDVRMGHKTRQEAMDELDDHIDEAEVKKMMEEIGYQQYYQSREDSEKYLVAYYVAAREIPEEELRLLIQQKLPVYMMPSYFVRLNDLPLTTNGKINRQLLPGIDAIRLQEAEHNYVPPSGEMEQAIAAEWMEVLKLDKTGINNNFFSLGGSSIKIVMLYERIDKLYPGLLKVSDLFDHPTIAAQAGLLRKKITKDKPVNAPGFEVIEL